MLKKWKDFIDDIVQGLKDGQPYKDIENFIDEFQKLKEDERAKWKRTIERIILIVYSIISTASFLIGLLGG